MSQIGLVFDSIFGKRPWCAVVIDDNGCRITYHRYRKHALMALGREAAKAMKQ